ncbi:ATP-dependent dethiobiotin synthetase BioD [Buchnera aphidicola (Macrosiphoniella sanborni)]|uniref:ATP-dependent dethiobiotin synthetase BioD n=1 Tax=Buchnera aphidicola (Macrosiphoniella sanborni) TaxID=1241865 RepID=A0A4D6YCU9_9GAMM|nr:dethiobiotin synthase [Buchnera aphidicola]QCI23828.1 ATP-dependent dethiobiotin synthetase BioD [Buchnera aphidicola (Macrosiphoniella sanborni)]
MIKKFFITGTDTNVGKTIASSILLKKATYHGYKTAGYKPISSGGKKKSNIILNNDTLILKKNSAIKLSNQEINPIAFLENAPPHILSCLYKRDITKQNMSLGLKKIAKKSNWIIIEGAGGWYTPLSYKDTFSNWVKKEKLTVIIVIAIKLGCINHAILTEQAIFSENIQCGGWIANNIVPNNQYNIHYIQTLLNYIKSPFLGEIPYLKNKNKIDYNKINIILPK